MIAKLSLCNCSQYPPKQSPKALFHVLQSCHLEVSWKKCPLPLWCSSSPSPTLRRKSVNCEDSPRSFDLMFCVSCNLVTICQRYEDFSVASTISGLDPCRTTGRICRQSPAKSTAKPPNGNDFFSNVLHCSVYLFKSMLVSHRLENSRNLRIQ